VKVRTEADKVQLTNLEMLGQQTAESLYQLVTQATFLLLLQFRVHLYSHQLIREISSPLLLKSKKFCSPSLLPLKSVERNIRLIFVPNLRIFPRSHALSGNEGTPRMPSCVSHVTKLHLETPSANLCFASAPVGEPRPFQVSPMHGILSVSALDGVVYW